MFVITPTVATAMAQKITSKIIEDQKKQCAEIRFKIGIDERSTEAVKLRTQAAAMIIKAGELEKELEATYSVAPFEVRFMGTDSSFMITKQQRVTGIRNEIILRNQLEGKNIETIEKELLELYK